MPSQQDVSNTPRRFTQLGDLAAAKKRVTFAENRIMRKSHESSVGSFGWKHFFALIVATCISFSIPAHVFRVQDPKMLMLARSALNSLIYSIVVNKQFPIPVDKLLKF